MTVKEYDNNVNNYGNPLSIRIAYLMRVIVAGGRLGVPRAAVVAVLDRLSHTWLADIVLIHGSAKGTDRFAGQWAQDRGIAVQPMPIDPEKDGYKDDAPKRRNLRMLQEGPDAIVAFPGGPGTRHMILIGDAKQVPIFDVDIIDRQFSVWRWGVGPEQPVSFLFDGSF